MTTTAPPKAPSALYLTDDQASCELIATLPEAFLIGFILDQQITVQKAFQGPSDLIDRIGTIEPKKLAAMPLAKLEDAFSEKPAIHRYPRAMAKRVHEAMQLIVDKYDGDAGKLLFTAADADEMTKRLLEIPGFGKPKAFTVNNSSRPSRKLPAALLHPPRSRSAAYSRSFSAPRPASSILNAARSTSLACARLFCGK